MIQLVYLGYVALSRIALALPERVAYGVAEMAGRVAAQISSKRAAVQGNLARITGEPTDSERVQSLVVAAYKSYARYWLETFRLVREGRSFFLDRFRATGQENLDGVLARGKGAIVVVGHLGNWDAAGAWVGARGNRLVTVAEVLRPRRMFDFFVEHRARLGMTIHAAERGATRMLVDAVESGAVVAILGDRDLKGRGPRVEFFGGRVPFPAGPASIALRTGVPLLVAGVYGTVLPDGRRGWEAEIGEPIELPHVAGAEAVTALTQEIAARLQHYVAKRPEEWHVFSPFWRDEG
ncbi:MAG: phosphatidylinositol mannoside acyltransferase [Actinomycetota bacterium]|nr:phosphatidylinositol mannoside acyltransferase [Actinomycetota bacterium]